jgi:hypothetical protein
MVVERRSSGVGHLRAAKLSPRWTLPRLKLDEAGHPRDSVKIGTMQTTAASNTIGKLGKSGLVNFGPSKRGETQQ